MQLSFIQYVQHQVVLGLKMVEDPWSNASWTCLIKLLYALICKLPVKWINTDSQCTVILTGWLFSPDSDWHQYTPVSDAIVELIVHVDPVCDPHSDDEQSSSPQLSVYLLTLHLSELLWSSQLRERETYVKCWVLLGVMIRETGGETPEKEVTATMFQI